MKTLNGTKHSTELFLSQLRLIFRNKEQRFANDVRRINHAASEFRGNAYAWFSAYLEDDDGLAFVSYKEFTTASIRRFGDTKPRGMAEE